MGYRNLTASIACKVIGGYHHQQKAACYAGSTYLNCQNMIYTTDKIKTSAIGNKKQKLQITRLCCITYNHFQNPPSYGEK